MHAAAVFIFSMVLRLSGGEVQWGMACSFLRVCALGECVVMACARDAWRISALTRFQPEIFKQPLLQAERNFPFSWLQRFPRNGGGGCGGMNGSDVAGETTEGCGGRLPRAFDVSRLVTSVTESVHPIATPRQAGGLLHARLYACATSPRTEVDKKRNSGHLTASEQKSDSLSCPVNKGTKLRIGIPIRGFISFNAVFKLTEQYSALLESCQGDI